MIAPIGNRLIPSYELISLRFSKLLIKPLVNQQIQALIDNQIKTGRKGVVEVSKLTNRFRF